MSDSVARTQADTQSLSESSAASRQKRLRLWPGVVLAAVLCALRVWAWSGEFSHPKLLVGLFFGPMAVLAGIVLWWLLASRLRWSDRLLVVVVFAATAAAALLLSDASFHGPGLLLCTLPAVVFAWVGWLAISFWLPWPVRRAGLLLCLSAVAVACCLLRVTFADANFTTSEWHWRWTPTDEQRFIATAKVGPVQHFAKGAAALSEQPGDWPAFRGPQRDNRLPGLRIAKTDWRSSPPPELWRHPIGPGWSSFAAISDRLFTQEQRGDDECVVCYDEATGKEVWAYADETRFSEVMGGDGPRATPTFHAGRLYAFGAKGILNCLDAASGERIWSRNIVTDPDLKAGVPYWGFASSPLVVQGLVVVLAAAPEGKTVLACKEETGELAWTAAVGPREPGPEKPPLSYCSPQWATIDNVGQILFATNAGVSGFEPAGGKELWHYPWPVDAPRVVQPAVLGGSDVLVGTGMGNGTRRIHVRRDGEKWLAERVWASTAINPYFNDFVVFKDHLYGIDGNKFVCVSLKDGSEAWRTMGYGNGEVLLLPDQELLLILSEQGDVALVSARPDKHEELCRFKALKGKTWNHPVIAHGKLFVRNDKEIACFQLEMAEEAAAAQNAAAVKP
jgi:outer membrane protein assembly factor BamB